MENYCIQNKFDVTSSDILYDSLHNIFETVIHGNTLCWFSESYGEVEDADFLKITKESNQFTIHFQKNSTH